MVTFSERVEIADRFVRSVTKFNHQSKTDYKLNTDPLTFIGWLESEGLLDQEACESKVAEYKLLNALGH